jgi:hypothetical protein
MEPEIWNRRNVCEAHRNSECDGFYARLLATFDHAGGERFLKPGNRALVLARDKPADLLQALESGVRRTSRNGWTGRRTVTQVGLSLRLRQEIQAVVRTDELNLHPCGDLVASLVATMPILAHLCQLETSGSR